MSDFKVKVMKDNTVGKTKKPSMIAAGDEMSVVMRMMTGDFNPNHDPNDGRFTEGSGGGSNKVDVSKGFPKIVKYDGEEYYKESEMTGGAWSYVRWDDDNNEQYITVNSKGEIERN